MYYGETLKKYRVLPSEDRMEQFVAIIASVEDAESSEALRDMLKDGFRPEASGFYQYSLETDTPELVTLVGRGYFFENGWSLDDTVSWIGPASEVRDAKD